MAWPGLESDRKGLPGAGAKGMGHLLLGRPATHMGGPHSSPCRETDRQAGRQSDRQTGGGLSPTGLLPKSHNSWAGPRFPARVAGTQPLVPPAAASQGLHQHQTRFGSGAETGARHSKVGAGVSAGFLCCATQDPPPRQPGVDFKEAPPSGLTPRSFPASC